jgi:hypothetical protein
MIQDHIDKIETKLRGAGGIPEETRGELLHLLSTLKTEIGNLSETHKEDAASITRFADLSAHEATREQKKPAQVETALHGLRSSVEGFESSHPVLVQIVNKFAAILSNMGI